ncbi:MAG: Thioesterase superfamily protein [Acidimicrobiia bacterium]|nr:Thioesterase superfamily protein [Acidimicrobiia bacterium]
MQSSSDYLERLGATGVAMRDTLGLRSVALARDQVVEEMDVAPWHLDQYAEMAPGALGLLADAALSRAVMAAGPDDTRMATSHLHVELLRAIPKGTSLVRCTAQARSIESQFGLSEGEIATDQGVVVARASLGAILLEPGPFGPDPVVRSAQALTFAPLVRPHRLLRGSPVHEALGSRVVSARSSGVRVAHPAAPHFSNLRGGLYGGIGVLMGERALDLALRVVLPEGTRMRPVELRAAYVRPIAADGSIIECHAKVMYLGRRLAVVRAEVLAPDGRVAVLVDGSYVPSTGQTG